MSCKLCGNLMMEVNGILCPDCQQKAFNQHITPVITIPIAEYTALKGYKDDYFDLIMEVGKVYPNETRHQTARRYIRERETYTNETNQCSEASHGLQG